MSTTVSTLFEQVNTAISTLVSRRVKSYTINGMTYTYNSLDELRRWRAELKNEMRSTRTMMRPVDISGDYD